MRYHPKEKHFSEATKKLHIPCVYRDKTGITIHVVIKDGFCYRSENCLVVECKYNRIQSNLEALLSLTW